MQTPRLPMPPALDRLVSAYLFLIGNTGEPKDIFDSWLTDLAISPVDRVWLDPEEKITIADVRTFTSDMLLQPFASSKRIGLVPRAHLLTDDAAHALLKTLEDPPRHAVFLLSAQFEDQLLPTVVSRCQRWRIHTNGGQETETDPRFDFDTLCQTTLRERFALAEVWAKEGSFIEYFDQLIRGARDAFLRGRISSDRVEALLANRRLADTNVGRRLLAETTLMDFPRGMA